MATGNPFGWQVENSSGTPVSGAKVYFKKSGTSTDQSAYTDKAITVPAANPVIADAAGWFAVYLDPTLDYDITIKSADDSVTYYTSTHYGLSDTSQPVDPTLTALAGLPTGANKVPAFTGTDTATVLTYYTSDRTITVGAAGDYDNLQDAVDAVDTIFNNAGYVTTIQLLEPVTITTQVLLRSASHYPIRITGAAWTSVTYGGIANSGSSGAHSITLTLTGRTWAVGDVIVITNTTGTGDHEVLRGCYRITGVAGNDVTFTHKGLGSWPTLSISTMTVSYVPGVIIASGTNILSDYHENRAADPGVLEAISGSWIVQDIAIVDTSSDADAHGVISGFYPGHIQLYDVGISGFKYLVRSVEPGAPIDTRYVYGHGASQDGITAQVGVSVVVSDCQITGCGGVGIRANNGSHVYAVDTFVGMCGNGFVSNGTMTMSNCDAKMSNLYDLYAAQNGDIYLSDFVGDGTCRVSGGGRLFIDSGGLTVDTIQLLEMGTITGEANLTASTKTYTLGTVDGWVYRKASEFVAGGVSSVTLTQASYSDIVFTEINDPDSVYNGSTGVFTAPRNGYYQFDVGIYPDDTEGAGGDDFGLIIARFVLTGASSGNKRFATFNPASTVQLEATMFTGSRMFYMDAGDTCKVQVYQSSGENKTANRGAEFWWFNGHLVSAA
jgi:hypothetical protein